MKFHTSPDLGLLVLRLAAGAAFVFHGAQMLFGAFGGYGIEGTAGWMAGLGIPFPTFSATMAGGTELIGGAALLTGLFTRLLSVPLTITMLVAAFTAHTGFDATKGGMEYPLVMAAAAFLFAVTGPGRFSLGAGRIEVPALRPEPAA